ncbi:hypothetical protein BS50DRAFT_637979 [Corynespora cassiicola Philippines]|uniref:Uncharacterized protein n=1 Tax=Corynespora cassiicola Philippines TaxID=1448308 RepID=A0A2T2NDI8_CORCC|nr:hypothetical protein BS50DRAFT_637979 [Corynespora cassiicola Philippines]
MPPDCVSVSEKFLLYNTNYQTFSTTTTISASQAHYNNSIYQGHNKMLLSLFCLFTLFRKTRRKGAAQQKFNSATINSMIATALSPTAFHAFLEQVQQDGNLDKSQRRILSFLAVPNLRLDLYFRVLAIAQYGMAKNPKRLILLPTYLEFCDIAPDFNASAEWGPEQARVVLDVGGLLAWDRLHMSDIGAWVNSVSGVATDPDASELTEEHQMMRETMGSHRGSQESSLSNFRPFTSRGSKHEFRNVITRARTLQDVMVENIIGPSIPLIPYNAADNSGFKLFKSMPMADVEKVASFREHEVHIAFISGSDGYIEGLLKKRFEGEKGLVLCTGILKAMASGEWRCHESLLDNTVGHQQHDAKTCYCLGKTRCVLTCAVMADGIQWAGDELIVKGASEEIILPLRLETFHWQSEDGSEAVRFGDFALKLVQKQRR